MPSRLEINGVLEKELSEFEIFPDILYGVFFSLFNDSDLASYLHEHRDPKPYSVNFYAIEENRKFLLFTGKNSDKRIKEIIISVSILDDELFPKILSSLVFDRKKEVALKDTTVKFIRKPRVYENRLVTYREILDNAKPENKITLIFYTPTTFKKGSNNFPVPLPSLIFSSLLRKWNAFSDLKIEDIEVSNLEESIKISGFRIETRKVDFSSMGWLVGFVGKVVFYADLEEEKLIKLNALCRFGEFSGVGVKTSMGFGKFVVK